MTIIIFLALIPAVVFTVILVKTQNRIKKMESIKIKAQNNKRQF